MSIPHEQFTALVCTRRYVVIIMPCPPKYHCNTLSRAEWKCFDLPDEWQVRYRAFTCVFRKQKQEVDHDWKGNSINGLEVEIPASRCRQHAAGVEIRFHSIGEHLQRSASLFQV